MRTIKLSTLAVLSTLWLSGCGAPNLCENRLDYRAVKETAKIKVPAELDPLPDVTQLEIPPSSTPPDVDTSCLEQPPRFFDESGQVAE
ncbi:MAG: hypothetical protein AAAFM81_14195 [Pseudomonadota bacterium]